MSVKQATGPARKGNYNPYSIRRCVRRTSASPEIVSLTTKSFTRRDETINHEPEIDITTGEVRCSCENFRYDITRLSNQTGITPSIFHPMLCCKHIERSIQNCIRHGEIVLNEDKSYSLAQPAPIPVNTVEAPAHIDADTGALKPGYKADGSFDYLAFFED